MAQRKKPRRRPRNRQTPATVQVTQRKAFARLASDFALWFSSHIRTAAGIAVALITIVGGAVALKPRVSVQVNFLRNTLTPAPIRFTITNEGPLDLHDVKFSCFIQQLDSGGFSFHNSWLKADWSGTERTSDRIAVAESASVECLTSNISIGYPNRSTAADLAVVLDFTTKALPFGERRIFRFVNGPTDGDWISQPAPSDYLDSSDSDDEH